MAGATRPEAATQIARNLNSRRLWLVTTNDNLDALRFYQWAPRPIDQVTKETREALARTGHRR